MTYICTKAQNSMKSADIEKGIIKNCFLMSFHLCEPKIKALKKKNNSC